MEERELLLTVERTGERLTVGKTAVFSLIKSGELKSVKIGRSRRVLADSVTAYIERLRAEQAGDVA